MAPEQARMVREQEQVESARIVGVHKVEFLGLPDGIVEYGVGLRRLLTRVVRRHRPEIVITGNFRDTWGGRNLNQADHIAVGRGVLDAVRDAGNRWIFPEVGPERWGGVREVWAFGSPEATHAVDTTDTLDRGVASLEAHAAYLAGLGWVNWDAREFLEGFGRQAGQRLGVAIAAPFEVFPMGWGE